MAHPAQAEFCKSVKEKLPQYFTGVNVLDIGSLDINGNNRYLFDNYNYTGIDIGPGKNVDVVCKGHEFKPEVLFDVVISTECFEHDKHYAETLNNAVRLLKPGGLLLFTCATTGRPEHGTTRSKTEWASPYSHIQFEEYYKNLTQEDIEQALPVKEIFSSYEFGVNQQACDLYFWGVKNN
jgi:cyclopropane fatty-acyl-phospholipid synthase-like methyltransferase